MRNAIDAIVRSLRNLKRPSGRANARRLRARGETPASFRIRDATASDVPALARLHVTAFNATHGWRRGGPTIELRERQWREAFGRDDGRWFCLVVERPGGELVAFAKGVAYEHPDLPDFRGELNKIYVLPEYQRQGLGRRLVGIAARRFLAQDVTSMVLFGEARNPSCFAWDALGGQRLYAANGEFHGGYGWRDLRRLASICPMQ
jgi:ribosomal protein S18 acetylase RimI-like enzyme